MLEKFKFTSTHGIYDMFRPHHYPEEREETNTKPDRSMKRDKYQTVLANDPEIEYKLRDHGRNYGGVVGNTTKDSKFTHDFQENHEMIQNQIKMSYPNDHIDKDHDDMQNDMRNTTNMMKDKEQQDEMYAMKKNPN